MLKKCISYINCICNDNDNKNSIEPIQYGNDEEFIYDNNKLQYNMIKYNKNIHQEKECIICFHEFSDKIAILPCVHYFHEKCIVEWSQKSNNIYCPICQY
jgi:E3 ubiquitin-protein ligase DOA10